MISVPSNYDTIISNDGHYEWKVVNGSNEFKDNLISGRLTSSIMEMLSVGNTGSMKLTLELWEAAIDTSSPLILQFRAVGDSVQSTWVTRGTFYIDTVETSPYSSITKVTAFDSMLKSEVTYSLSGGWVSTTDKAVVQDIAAEMGVSIESSTQTLLNTPIALNNAPNVGPNGVTDRQMLSYIGVLRGGNWRMTADNKLMLQKAYTTPSATANIGDAVEDFDASPVETVKRVKVIVDAETYYLAPASSSEAAWLAVGGRCLEVNLPFWGTQAVANDLLSKFNNKSFYPYTARNAYVDPKYTCGDGITIKDVTSVIVSQTINIDGLSSSDMNFKGEEAIQSLYPYVSPSERNIMYVATKAQETADDAVSAASGAATTANGAIYREQTIFKQAVSGTSTMSGTTTWVTATGESVSSDTAGLTPVWTTKRPTYRSNYPVLFVATQRQTMAQKSGTTCTCTTPLKDDTTTIIDGGHITTGTIDAGVVNVTNINASNISTGTLDASLIETGGIVIEQLDTDTQTAISNGSSAYSRADASRGTSSTAATTAAKTVTSAGFTLVTGSAVTVYFSTANTKADAALTLNVNSTGAKTIYVAGAATSSTNQLLWVAGSSITFVYDGTYWRVEDAPGTYRGAACSVAAATAAKTSSVTGLVLFKGVKVSVPMTYENTNTSATLNTTSLGAKAIYYGTGTTRPTTSNGYGWIAGQTPTFEFDGATWRLQSSGTIINGDHITTGTINANLIRTGVIQDGLNPPKNSWDLTTGEFTTIQGEIGGWTITEDSLTSQFSFVEEPNLQFTTYMRSKDVSYSGDDAVVFGIKATYQGSTIEEWAWQQTYLNAAWQRGNLKTIVGPGIINLYDGDNAQVLYLHSRGSTRTGLHMVLYDGGTLTVSNNETLTISGALNLDSRTSISGNITLSGAVTPFSFANGTTSGPVLTLGTSTVTVPSASSSQSGVVTTGSQSFDGYKTFLSGATAGSSAATGSRYFVASSNSGTIDLLSVGNADGNGGRGIWVDAHGTGSDKWALRVDTDNNVFLPSGTTCSGTFTALASINTIGTSTNGAIYAMRFSDKDDSIYGQVYAARSANNGGRIRITQFSENSSGTLSGGRERYSFPVCEQGLTETVDYTIYTSKNRADIFKSQPTLNFGTQYTTIKFNPSISVDSEYYGLFGIDVGSTTTPTRSRFYFQEASVSTADGVTTGYNELYYLPASDNNRTASAAYTILTTKDYDFAGAKKVEIPASGSVTLTMTGSARALVISNGGNANQRGAYIIYQGGSVKAVASASAITTSYSGSTVTFTSTATVKTYLDIIIFNGSIA